MAASPAGLWRPSLLRFILFLALWCILIGIGPEDLAVGMPVAFLGAIAANRLLGAPRSVRPARALLFAARFLRQSLLAGLDVAMRAFAPSLPLATGFVSFRPKFPESPRRDLFLTISSMMPGTLPVGGGAKGDVIIHCLDATRPIAGEMSADEARFAAIFREAPHG